MHGVGQKGFQRIGRFDFRSNGIVHVHDDPDREALLVGIQEPAAGHALGSKSDDAVGSALIPGQVEALLNYLARQPDQLFHPHG